MPRALEQPERFVRDHSREGTGEGSAFPETETCVVCCERGDGESRYALAFLCWCIYIWEGWAV